MVHSGSPLLDEELALSDGRGSQLEVLLNIRPLQEKGRLTGAVCAFHDVTERKQAERALRTMNEQLERRVTERTSALAASESRLAADLAGMRRLHDLHARLATETDLKAALDDILRAACEFTATDRGCIQLVSDDGTRLEMYAWHGYPDDSPFIEHFRHEGLAEGCDVARVQRQRFVIADTAAVPALVDTPAGDAAAASGIRAAQSTPMVSRKGETVGVLSTQFDRPHVPGSDQLRLVDLLAWAGADFVERHRASQALQQSEAALAADLRDTLLLHRISSRADGETGLQSLYMDILDTAIELVHADAGTVQILDDASGELLLLGQRNLETLARHFMRVPAGSHTPCGIALARKERIFQEFDHPQHDDPHDSDARHREAGLRCAQSTPLVTRRGRPIGMLTTHWRSHHRPGERELRYIDLLARQAADLIEREKAVSLLYERDDALERQREHVAK